MKAKLKFGLIFCGLVFLLIFTEGLNMFFPFTSCSSRPHKERAAKDSISGKISISGAFALYPLTVKWSEEFKKIHPDIKIDISAGGAGKGMTDVLSGMVDLAMFSREVSVIEEEKGAWKIAVAQDAVFPTINTSNPEYQQIVKMGLTRDQFHDVFLVEHTHWDHYLNNGSDIQLNVYTRSDACGAAATWAGFFDKAQEDLLGTGVYGDPGMADAVRKDKFGVGYNNLVFLYNLKTNAPNPGISAIPIDLNGNRVIDAQEDFYCTLDKAMKAIELGIYPAPPSRKLYLITKGEPTNVAVKAFLTFVLNKGQDFVANTGYIQLQQQEIEKQNNRLNP